MDDTQKNTTDIAVLQNQVTTVMEDIKEIKEGVKTNTTNSINHENKDQERQVEVLGAINTAVGEIRKEIKSEHIRLHERIESLEVQVEDVRTQQKVDKVKLGTLITILASIGSVILKVALDGLTHLVK